VGAEAGLKRPVHDIIFPVHYTGFPGSHLNADIWGMQRLVLSLLFLLSSMAAAAEDTLLNRSPGVEKVMRFIVRQDTLGAREASALLDSLLQLPETRRAPLTEARLHLENGRKQQNAGEMAASVKSYTRAYTLFDSLHNSKGITGALINLGVTHIILNKPATAREYFENGLKLGKDISDQHLTKLYMNIGVTHDMEGRSELAISYYQKATASALRSNDYEAMAQIYHAIGIAYAMMHNFPESEKYELKALETEKLKPSPKLRSQVLGSMGSFYHEQKKYPEAEKYLADAIAIARAEKFWDVQLICYRELADVYREMGRNEDGMKLLDEYVTLKDSIDQLKADEVLADKETKFRLDLHKRALELTEVRSDNRFRLALVLGLVCFLLLLLSFMFFRNYRLKQKANKLLALEKAQVETERQNLQQENLVLQQENMTAKFETLKNQINPHFLFNALNSLYALVESDPKKAQDFILQFSLMYRKVLAFNDLPVITLKQELELVNSYLYLQKIRFGENLRVTMDMDAQTLSYFIPPFTIQMLLENAVKHNVVSADDPLFVSIASDLQKAELRVTNSLSIRKAAETASTGTGLKNIIRRYEILSDRAPQFGIRNNRYEAVLPLLTEDE
jgi:tetratricopeptide (TPR) repeat protein